LIVGPDRCCKKRPTGSVQHSNKIQREGHNNIEEMKTEQAKYANKMMVKNDSDTCMAACSTKGTHATCRHFTRNGNPQQKRRCWQCKLDPTVVGGGSNLCNFCCVRIDRCKCKNHTGAMPFHKKNVGSAVNPLFQKKPVHTMEGPFIPLTIPGIQTSEVSSLVAPIFPDVPDVEHFRKSAPVKCQHISSRTGRPRDFKRCWQCKLDPAVEGGGEELCGKHFVRRDVCKCSVRVPVLVEKRTGLKTKQAISSLQTTLVLEDPVTHTLPMLSLPTDSTAVLVQLALRRQRIISKFAPGQLTSGLGVMSIPITHTTDEVKAKEQYP